MELRQLTYLDAVVRHGGFTRAAEAIHVAQPAISAQIKRLEHELGVELLHRTTRSVELTHIGRRFHQHVAAVLGQLDAACADVDIHRGVEGGHVRIGATPLLGGLDLVDVLRRFRSDDPGVTLSLRTGLAATLHESLLRGELDVVITPWNPDDDGALDVAFVAAEQLVLITSPSDRRTITTLADVASDPFVCLAADSGLRRLLDLASSALDTPPRVEFETHSPASIRALVSSGLGSAIVAESAVIGPGDPVRMHRIAGLPSHPPICVLHDPRAHGSDGPPSAAQRFVAALTDA